MILLVLLHIFVLVNARRSFDKLVIFGDSLSDTGNAYKLSDHTWPIVPPYFRGQYCDGRNWVARLFGFRKHNYAYGGATTDNNFIQGYTRSDTLAVPGVRQQVELYFHEQIEDKTVDLSRTLFILWAGGNDLNNNATIPPAMIVDSLLNSVQDLLELGAKNVLVFNQPPIEAFPSVRRLGQNAYFVYLTKQINDAFEQKLATMQDDNPDARIYRYDVHTLVNQMLNNETSIKFQNVTDRCWTTKNMTVIRLCQDPKTYIYVDSLHFSSSAHSLIADGLIPFLNRPRRHVNQPDSLVHSFK